MQWFSGITVLAALGCAITPSDCLSDEPVVIDYSSQIAPIFTKYCTGCHNTDDLEGGLSLESFAALQEGGADGVALLPGQSDSSRMIRMLTGAAEPKMPPDDNPPPKPEEIELLRRWIDSGAKGPAGEEIQTILITPYIPPDEDVARPVTALALSPDGSQLALGRYGRVDVLSGVLQEPLFSLEDLPGKVNALSFSSNGGQLVVATGVAGLRGQAIVYDATSGEKQVEISGHRDVLHEAILSPDGGQLATCSYDREIILWDAITGKQRVTLSGHNGPIFDIDFAPSGEVLASASGDGTIKLWRTTDGARLDTLSQPQGEQYAVAFSPDGRYVVGGGADNRIRVWQFVSREQPRINPLLFARFGHEGAIVALAFSRDGASLVSTAEDRTLKAWQTTTFTETRLYEQQPDVVTSLAVSPRGQTILVARMDGQWRAYDLPAAVTLTESGTPNGIQALPLDREQTAITSTSQDPASGVDEVGGRGVEIEPNDSLDQAQSLELPTQISGIIDARTEGQGEVDVFRFRSEAGSEWMIEINAARQESALDSFVEVLDGEGRSIERVLLQAVRDSYFTFRGKDSFTSDDFRVQNWEEMKLNQFLYAGGEVVKLWHYPRGPDSGFMVYPGEGQRYTYFDTTPLSHALGEPCYIVQPHPPGTRLIPNGLPVFPIYYENDDDSRREWGADSRLTFTAPRDGEYLVRLRDARGFGGDAYKYELTIRPRQPDFSVKLDNQELKVGQGTGKEFRLTAVRRDGFEGPIQVDIGGLPDGFSAISPITIEAGQIAAYGAVYAAADAEQPSQETLEQIQMTATARIHGYEVVQQVERFSNIELAEAPKLVVRVLPATEEELHSGNLHAAVTEGAPPAPEEPIAEMGSLELTITPGETIAARVRLSRHGFDGEVSLGGADSGRNLPHGVYVDNIGLNGLTILSGQNERVFFITADDWVPEQSRTFHLKSNAPGNPTSPPILLHVKR